MSVNVELARTFLWAQQIRKEHTYLLARFDEVKGHQAQQDERVQVSLEENHRRFDAYTKVFNDKVETAEGRQAHLIADLASVVAAYRASNNELQQQHNVLKERLNSLEQVVGSLQHAPQGSRTDGRMTDSQFEFDHPRAPDATLSMIRDVPSLVARGQQARLPYVSLFGAAENSCASQELPRLSQIHNAGNATPIQLTRVRSPNLDASQPAGPATPSTVVSPVPSPLTINKTKVNTLQLSMPYTLGPSPADGLSPLYSRRTDDPSQVTDVAGLCSLVSESQSKVAAESRTPAPIIEIPDSLAEKADKTDKTLENEALAKFQPKRKRNKKKWNPIPSRPPTRRSARVAAKSHYTLPCPESQPVPDSQPFLADGTLGCFALDRRHGGDTAGQVPVPGAQRHAPTTRPIKGFRVDMREMPSQVKGG